MESSQNNSGQPLPPKVDLKKQATAADSSDADAKARFQTMEISLPDLEPAAPSAGPTGRPTTSAKPVSVPVPPKRETARIPFDPGKAAQSAQAGVAASGPTTIRIKPALSKATVDLKPFSAATANLAGLDEDILKRKTSRISIEDAAAQQGDAEAGDGGPRTIRLKKPGEAAPRVAATATAPIPPVENESTDSGGRKKTVKLRRAGPEDASAAAAAPEMEVLRGAPAPVADSIHWTFGLFAVAAMLVAAVAVYVLLAQLTGPNLCLTQLSAFWPGANLPWFNKLPFIQ
jgi:hypothetical protein